MVKPFEEEQEGFLKEEQITVLRDILFRYIKDNYKQFKWKDFTVTKFYVAETDYLGAITLTMRKPKGVLRFIFDYSPKKDVGRRGMEEEIRFEIKRSMTPKQLGDIAKNAFRWFKQQMDKVSN